MIIMTCTLSLSLYLSIYLSLPLSLSFLLGSYKTALATYSEAELLTQDWVGVAFNFMVFKIYFVGGFTQ